MSANRFKLPKDNTSLARTVDTHVSREEQTMAWRRLMWQVAWYYINGARRFDIVNAQTGALSAFFTDTEGNMEYQHQELLSLVDRTVGRLKEIDIWPLVSKTEGGLAAVRERSVMQVLMDATIHPQSLDVAADKFIHLFALLGSAGISGNVVDNPSGGLTADFEVIHPRELFPFPSPGSDYTKVTGMVRQRALTLDFLKERYGRKVMANKDQMTVTAVPFGSAASVDPHVETDWGGLEEKVGGESAKDKTHVEIAKVREIWTKGAGDRCLEYAVMSGDYVIERQDFSEIEAYCPIGMRPFIDIGSFHGAGLFDLLFSAVRELEKLLKWVYNNVRDVDQYGFLVLPHGGFQHEVLMKDVGKKLKVAYYEPDVAGQDVKPFHVAPFTAGDLPAKIAAIAHGILEGLSPVRDLADEKGRIDSAAGLAFLDEKMGRYMTNSVNALRGAFGEMYRALAASLLEKMMTVSTPLPVNRLTTDLAGALIDPETMTLTFENNPVPTLSRMMFSIRGRTIQSQAARVQRALELAQGNPPVVDPIGLRLFFLKEGMEVPMWMEEEKAAYEMVVQNILILYGNGMQPGEIMFTPHTVRPELQLRVLGAFMQSPTMAVAGPEVWNGFQDYRESLLEMMAPILPTGVPPPEDIGAVLNEMAPQETPDVENSSRPGSASPSRGQPARQTSRAK